MPDPNNSRPMNRYQRIIEQIFLQRYQPGLREVPFDRQDLATVARALGIEPPKNLGDLLYTFRYRAEMPESVRTRAPEGEEWTIRPAGKGSYAFVLGRIAIIVPNELLAEIKIPDATPGLVASYSLSDEQALLAKVRYNRLIDIFTGIACYSLQNHLRTTVVGIGQVETDELYIGVDRSGAQYIIPVQAKGHRDRIGIVQIGQDMAMCAEKFPLLACRTIAAQFMAHDLIALFEFVEQQEALRIIAEKHYRLVSPESIAPEDLQTYQMASKLSET
jgi:hypothetical protein